MLTMTGTVQNVFTTPEGQARDGTKYGGLHKIQMSILRKLRNGEQVLEQYDLTVSDKNYYLERQGQQVSIQVEPYAIENGRSVPVRFKPVE